MRRAIRRKVVEMLVRMNDKPLSVPTDHELDGVNALRTRFETLSEISSTPDTPASEVEWNRNMNRLRKLVLSEDPREFLRWDVILDTMFVRDATYLKTELAYLRNHSDWRSTWKNILNEDPVGHPEPYAFYPQSSGNLIHHAYHLARYQDDTGECVGDQDLILEFGGGYGSFCRAFHKLGFQGKYVIFDLPHFSELQRFYLSSVGIATLEVEDFQSSDQGVLCISGFENLKHVVDSLPGNQKQLFTATWSLSESPKHIRDEILPLISQFDSFLIAYQHRFNEMDNLEQFRQWRETLPHSIFWKDQLLPHLPHNSYLFGYTSS